jgi:hypothetical protein
MAASGVQEPCPEGTVDRNGYVFCVLEKFYQRLKHRDILRRRVVTVGRSPASTRPTHARLSSTIPWVPTDACQRAPRGMSVHCRGRLAAPSADVSAKIFRRGVGSHCLCS